MLAALGSPLSRNFKASFKPTEARALGLPPDGCGNGAAAGAIGGSAVGATSESSAAGAPSSSPAASMSSVIDLGALVATGFCCGCGGIAAASGTGTWPPGDSGFADAVSAGRNRLAQTAAIIRRHAEAVRLHGTARQGPCLFMQSFPRIQNAGHAVRTS